MSETLVEGWTAHQDAEGRTFYHCAASGESSWSLPEAVLLLEGWTAHSDSEGRTFYHNVTTGATQWECPAVLAGPVVAALPNASSEILAVGTTQFVVEYIQQLAVMPETESALGVETAQRIGIHALGVHAALASPDTDPEAPDKVIEAVRNLAKECFRLRTFKVSPLAGEIVAATFAAAAGLMEPSVIPGGKSLDVAYSLKVMQMIGDSYSAWVGPRAFLLGMAKDMDAFLPQLFENVGRPDAAIAKRNRAAFSGVCAWMLTAFCRAMGCKLTADALWEWAIYDAFWIAVLAKGALTLDEVVRSVPDTPFKGAFYPPEFSRIQNVLTGAFFSLTGPTVAFRNLSSSLKAGSEVNEVSTPEAKFTEHWAKLAMAVAESDLVGPLLQVTQGPACDKKAQLVDFFAKIMQSELLQDPHWISTFPRASLIVEAARGAAAHVRNAIGRHAHAFWALLATVPASGHVPRSFQNNCAELAFCCLVAVPECASLIRLTLTSNHQLLAVAGADPAPITALCIFAANAGITPGIGDDGGLSDSLSSLHPDVRTLVSRRMLEWTGSAAQNALACWAAFLQGALLPPFVPEQMQASMCLTAAHQEVLRMKGLRRLLARVPPQLCCAVDRQLLIDPVRSPSGQAFEYTTLALTLAQNGSRCPVTGQPLTLESCWRDEELQLQAASWIRTLYK